MTFWAIRHKPSGFFLPARDKKRRGGYTHDEPRDPKIYAPRLFPKRTAAHLALKHWLDGVMTEIVDCFTGEYDTYIKVVKKPERKPEEMELVEMEVTVKSCHH